MTVFGISLAPSVREPIRRIVDLVVDAERGGFEYAYVLDSQMAFKDAYVTLALIAERTRRIRMGTGVTNPITRDLTVTASTNAALQEISGGRAVLGFGSGGTATDGIGLRGAKLGETRDALTKLRALLDGRDIEHNDMTIRMEPASPYVPIYLSATRPKMLRLAGELADGVILMGSSHKGMLQNQLELVLAGLAESGRDRSEFHVDLWQTIAVASDKQVAIEAVKSWVTSTLVYWFARGAVPAELHDIVDQDQLAEAKSTYVISEHLSLSAKHRALVSEELADVMTIAGDDDHCVGRLAELSELGVDSITLTLLSGGREERLDSLKRVIASAARTAPHLSVHSA